MGRAADPKVLAKEGEGNLVDPSAIAVGEGASVPRALREEDIYAFIGQCVEAAKNPMEAGFDVVEVQYGGPQYWTRPCIDLYIVPRTDT